MNISILRRFIPLLLVVGWAASLSALTLGSIFQGLLIPNQYELQPQQFYASPLLLWIFYLGSFGICVLAAMLISDIGKSLISVFFAYGLTVVITFAILALPDFSGIIQPPGILQQPSVLFTFNALFPLPLFTDLVGTIVGSGLGERLL